jgi:hypothetical protein
MRKVIRINPKTHMLCIPEEIAEDGMVGDVDSYPNAVTLTLVVPGASLEDVEASLMRTLDDIRHRIKFTERNIPRREESKPAKHGTSSFDELRQKIRGVK